MVNQDLAEEVKSPSSRNKENDVVKEATPEGKGEEAKDVTIPESAEQDITAADEQLRNLAEALGSQHETSNCMNGGTDLTYSMLYNRGDTGTKTPDEGNK